MEEYKNFPKLHSPFVRQDIDGYYVVTEELDPNEGWFLEDGVIAVDKIDGTNVGILIEDGVIKEAYNRDNPKTFLSIRSTGWDGALLEGLGATLQRGWLKAMSDGWHYGELIGPIINGNRHGLRKHMWVPFDYLKEKCKWRSWEKNKYPKDFQTIKEWFSELPSLFNMRFKKELPEIKAEGLVFNHPDGRSCKLRRDMFIEYWRGDWGEIEDKDTKHKAKKEVK